MIELHLLHTINTETGRRVLRIPSVKGRPDHLQALKSEIQTSKSEGTESTVEYGHGRIQALCFFARPRGRCVSRAQPRVCPLDAAIANNIS